MKLEDSAGFVLKQHLEAYVRNPVDPQSSRRSLRSFDVFAQNPLSPVILETLVVIFHLVP